MLHSGDAYTPEGGREREREREREIERERDLIAPGHMHPFG